MLFRSSRASLFKLAQIQLELAQYWLIMIHVNCDSSMLVHTHELVAGALGRSEDLTLGAIEVQAKQSLYTRPTDLLCAQQLIREYEQALNCRN